MGTDFKCGCRVSGSWFLCEKHENIVIDLINQAELNENTVADIVQDKKGKTIKYVNERPMEKVK